ncbi:MAG: hypothetical protein LBG75_02280 [Candidatus Nomurabacteria bacterium]|jgi:ribosomal protein S27AE|nr:hypothetical protein [Candidatus Nomurabacteria bacterium]
MILKVNNFLVQLENDFPSLVFKESADFAWQADSQTVRYNPKADHWQWLLLHEVGHAGLGHAGYKSDLELIRLESEAWEYAKKHLAPKYGADISDAFIEDHKDSYREWLHKRSQCPKCGYGGWQTGPDHYKCPSCFSAWKVNSDKFKHVYRRLNKK